MKQHSQHPKKTSARKQMAAAKAAAAEPSFPTQQEEEAALEQHHNLIAEKAYLLAEQRGFEGNHALDDWLQAEMEIESNIAAKH